MTARSFWARKYALLGEFIPSGPPFTNTLFPLVKAPASSNPDATVRRIFLDVRFGMYWNDGISPQPDYPWWTALNLMVAAGVGDNSDIPRMHPFDTEDARVTLTGAPPVTTGPNYKDPKGVSAIFQTSVSLESQGARKSPTPGQPPVGTSSFFLEDLHGVLIDPHSQLTIFGFAYIRVLYHDPS